MTLMPPASTVRESKVSVRGTGACTESPRSHLPAVTSMANALVPVLLQRGVQGGGEAGVRVGGRQRWHQQAGLLAIRKSKQCRGAWHARTPAVACWRPCPASSSRVADGQRSVVAIGAHGRLQYTKRRAGVGEDATTEPIMFEEQMRPA